MIKQNLSGTTLDTFQIGKNGPTMRWGLIMPVTLFNDGDYYFKTAYPQGLYQQIDNSWKLIGANYSIEVPVNFGTNKHFVKTTVSVDWAEFVSDIFVSDIYVGNSSKSAEDLLLEQISFKITNITNTGFDLLAYAPTGTFGIFNLIIRGK
jgi:hypothetical protein